MDNLSFSSKLGRGLTLHFDKLSVLSLPKEEALLYPVRNNALLLPPGQVPPRKGSCPGGRPSLRARGSSEPEAGPAAAAGF
jgi:hypothetical protein